MKNTQKLGPLYVFIGIISAFSLLIGFFLCLRIPTEDLDALILFYSLIAACIGILFLQLVKLRHKQNPK